MKNILIRILACVLVLTMVFAFVACDKEPAKDDDKEQTEDTNKDPDNKPDPEPEKCPDCGKEHAIFGESKVEALAKQHNIPTFAKLPIDPAIAAKVDAGKVEAVSGEFISGMMDVIVKEIG